MYVTIYKDVSIVSSSSNLSSYLSEEAVEDQTLPFDVMLNQRQAISKSVHAAELSDYQNWFLSSCLGFKRSRDVCK